MNTLDPRLIGLEMDRMVCRYKSRMQMKSPAEFAGDYLEALIDNLVNDINTRTRRCTSIVVHRQQLPYPFDGRFALPETIPHGSESIDIEVATIGQVAAYLLEVFDGAVLVQALEDLEHSVEQVGFGVAVEHVGLLLNLVTRKKQIAPSIKLTNKNGRVVCKLKHPDIRVIKAALPHLKAINTATGQAGLATPFVQFISRIDVHESGDVLCADGKVSIEVFKKHINVCVELETFDVLHDFLKEHQQSDCQTRAVKLAA